MIKLEFVSKTQLNELGKVSISKCFIISFELSLSRISELSTISVQNIEKRLGISARF